MEGLFSNLPTDFAVEVRVSPASIVLASGATLFIMAVSKRLF